MKKNLVKVIFYLDFFIVAISPSLSHVKGILLMVSRHKQSHLVFIYIRPVIYVICARSIMPITIIWLTFSSVDSLLIQY